MYRIPSFSNLAGAGTSQIYVFKLSHIQCHIWYKRLGAQKFVSVAQFDNRSQLTLCRVYFLRESGVISGTKTVYIRAIT